MNFVAALRKRWAIRSYVRKLPRLLRRDYGAAPRYTPAQIRKTIERYDLNQDYSCYAISMFSDRTGFDFYHQSIGESCDYDSMRAEVASAHFQGDASFTVSQICEVSIDGSHHGGAGDGHSGVTGHDTGSGH